TFEKGIMCPKGAVTAFMLYELVQIVPKTELEGYLTPLHELLNEYNNKRLKVVVYYALAKCCHRLADYNQAFDYFKLANSTQLEYCDFKTEYMQPFFSSI
ncbi:protein-tyrosine sulfotransferase, partial [Pseudoalteromonas ruthenica]